ncbi:MAG: hypothetical protein HQ477_07595 [Chloroflexi bacterium]|nr:hypothetical protein [Chloroflexota bacterium]
MTNGDVSVLYFKSCLRCKDGTVELGSDNFGSFLSCLTCGYTINSRSIRSNGSIDEPMTLDEDIVVAPQLQPVALADDEYDDTDFYDDGEDDELDELDDNDTDLAELEHAAI